jgi:hypothetical protein
MLSNTDIQAFMAKVKAAEAGHQLDLSSDEDLSIAVMNLISIEEHLFFTGNKTGKTKYFDLLNQAREMRKELLKIIIKDPEGELWCTSKHLLAASMRLFEVGTKSLSKGDKTKATNLFHKSFDLYNLFWGLNLGLVKPKETNLPFLKGRNGDLPASGGSERGLKKSDLFGKINTVISKILDCCRE